MKYCLISPRLAIQKGDLFGSGVPYWPTELAILASQIRLNDELQFIDMFGLNPSNIEVKDNYYLQGISHDSLITILEPDVGVVVIFAISYMSHLEVLEIVSLIKIYYPDIRIVILENSQAVTGYDLEKRKFDFFKSGADFLLCGISYDDWESIKLSIMDEFKSHHTLLHRNENNEKKLKRMVDVNEHCPYPAWDLLPLANYWKLPYSHGPKSGKFLPILTSKGCPYSCDFCVVPATNSRRWRPRNADDVVGEMEFMLQNYAITHFQVEDLNPTVDARRWDEIANLVIEKGLKLTYSFVSGTKSETLDIEKLANYRKSGLSYFSISPESGSPRLMKTIGKHFDYDYALELIKKSKELGIYSQACFIIGHPNETKEDFFQTRSYLRKLLQAGLSEIAVFIVAPFPGSQLYNLSKIGVNTEEIFTSFTPKNRIDYKSISKLRNVLIFDFLIFRLIRPKVLLSHLYRSLIGTPETKIENLPKRILFIIPRIVIAYFSSLLHSLKRYFKS
jgi:radical SAM superfamily enzyme YgiQ (UPF0313 family)